MTDTPLTPLTLELLEALKGISDDYMTSEKHHPGHVLIPAAKFERLCRAEAAISKAETPEQKDFNGAPSRAQSGEVG